jgi:hypothetical protein
VKPPEQLERSGDTFCLAYLKVSFLTLLLKTEGGAVVIEVGEVLQVGESG